MTKNSSTKKSSAAKKLVPAAGMLAVSAAMLASSTYAWFTMSREVEVKNIQMTATTPEDIQLSIGALGVSKDTAVSVAGKVSLTGNTGVLVKGNGSDTADNGQVLPPTTDAWNWSNTADISNYYSLGMLIPASSTTGEAIYFTPDADGVGQTIKSGAAFIRADSTVNGATGVADSGSKSYKTTLHAKTSADDNWSGTVSTQYNITNDDGYYVDIPVWLRTSSSATTTLGVKAYVIPKTDRVANENGEALYKAVRVAILNGDQTTIGGNAASGTTGLIAVADGMNGTVTKDNSGTISSTPFAGASILNWYNHSGTVSEGVTVNENVAAKAAAIANTRFDADIYGKPTIYDVDTGFVTLSPGANNDYGKATQVVVRVWLEGEDPDCWNDTAGQDWSINIKFHKIDTTPSESDINTSSNS